MEVAEEAEEAKEAAKDVVAEVAVAPEGATEATDPRVL